jgi:CRP-like cAMP-binding protein
MRMRRKTETLATVGLFRSLDAANIDLLDTQCSWRRLSRNQWIVDYQDTSNDVFFIVSGAVRVKLQSASGREVLLREINAGDFSANWPRSTMSPVRQGSSPSRMSR